MFDVVIDLCNARNMKQIVMCVLGTSIVVEQAEVLRIDSQ